MYCANKNTNQTNNQSSKQNNKSVQSKKSKQHINEKQPKVNTSIREKRSGSRTQIHIHQPPSHHLQDDDVFDVLEMSMQELDIGSNNTVSKSKKKRNRKKKSNVQIAVATVEPTPVPSNIEPCQEINKIVEEATICVICHNSLLDDPTQVTKSKSCEHTFCYTCIKTWSTQYASKCPLCKVKITTLVREGVVDEHITTIGIRHDDTSQTEMHITTGPLDCLDHDYFLSEVELLLNESKRILSTMERTQSSFNSNYRFNSRVKTDYRQRYFVVQEAVMDLTQMKSEFQLRRDYDPFFTLSELYKIQDKISDRTHEEVVSYQDEDDDYYDDDFDEDEELERQYVRCHRGEYY